MTDDPDGLVITYRVGAEHRRIRFARRDDGRWDYIEEWHNGCKWLPRGHEIVEDVRASGSVDGAVVLEEGPR